MANMSVHCCINSATKKDTDFVIEYSRFGFISASKTPSQTAEVYQLLLEAFPNKT